MAGVKKFRSQNLLGENPEQEAKRLLKESIKMIQQRKTPLQVRDAEIRRGGKGFLRGTTKHQRQRRLKILLESKIKTDCFGRII